SGVKSSPQRGKSGCVPGVGRWIFRFAATQVPVYENSPASCLMFAVGSRKCFRTTPFFPSAPIIHEHWICLKLPVLSSYPTITVPSNSSRETTLELHRSSQYWDFSTSLRRACSTKCLWLRLWITLCTNKTYQVLAGSEG